MLGEREMDEVYLFKCLECELEFKLRKGVGGSSTSPRTRFYCQEYGKISIESQCRQCSQYLKRVIFPLEGNTIKLEEAGEELKVKCPHCSSNQTILTLLDKWVIDYQMW